MASDQTLLRKARRVKFILLDVDGVMTDGGLYYSTRGVEMKRFDVHDGYGISRARESGFQFGIISGRDTPAVARRAKDLKILEVHQGRTDKLTVLREMQKRIKLHADEFCFIGDDLFDLPLLNAVGFSAAPANARPEVKRAVDYVCKARGGAGAVREVIDLFLKSVPAVR